MFYRVSGNEKLIVVLYVADGLVAASSKVIVSELLSNLENKFKITIETLGSFLNMLICRQNDGSIFINQKAYAESIVKRFNMESANPVSIPIEKCQLTEEAGDELTDAPYREAVGCLMYLAVAIRPDIAYAVNYASQFLEKPGHKHWEMIKRIFKYIKGTVGLGIRYNVACRSLVSLIDEKLSVLAESKEIQIGLTLSRNSPRKKLLKRRNKILQNKIYRLQKKKIQTGIRFRLRNPLNLLLLRSLSASTSCRIC